MFAFEMQFGPFAVAQLRITGELAALTKQKQIPPMHLYVANTLENPDAEIEESSVLTKALSEQHREANKIKKSKEITVVIGNPPYKEKAKGKGGWIEAGGSGVGAPLNAWKPPADWGVGAHSQAFEQLVRLFLGWATWKVFDHGPGDRNGIVCFISVAGFLNGPGFQTMRDYLRRKADDIWVIDCTPEGHQPEVNTRIFQGVQHRSASSWRRAGNPTSRPRRRCAYRALPAGIETKSSPRWRPSRSTTPIGPTAPPPWRGPFLPAATGAWATYPKLADFFYDNGSGVMPGRTWVIAPDADSLEEDGKHYPTRRPTGRKRYSSRI